MRGTRWIRREGAWLLTMGIAVGQAGPLQAAASDPERTLVVRVENRANVPAKVLTLAGGHVERIYADAGVRTLWVDSDGTSPPILHRNALEVVVVLTPEDIADLMAPEPHIMGIALSNNGVGCRRAYVFPARVSPHAERAAKRILFPSPTAAEALVLGQVIAHEVGHLMLPSGNHPRTGIMRAQIVADEAFHGQLSFSPEEGAFVRGALAATTVLE